MIVTVIHNAVNALSTVCSFFHGEKWEQNLQDEQAVFPLVMLEHPVTSTDEIVGQGNYPTTYDLTIFFSNKSKLSDFQTDRQPNIDAMLALKREFLLRLNQDPAVDKIISSKTTELINVFNLNLDGILLKLSVKLRDIAPVCLSPYGGYVYPPVTGLISPKIDQTPNNSGSTYGTLAGVVDGVNKVFTVSRGNYITKTLQVFAPVMMQMGNPGGDWVETNPSAGTFTFNVAPPVGTVITVISFGT